MLSPEEEMIVEPLGCLCFFFLAVCERELALEIGKIVEGKDSGLGVRCPRLESGCEPLGESLNLSEL